MLSICIEAEKVMVWALSKCGGKKDNCMYWLSVSNERNCGSREEHDESVGLLCAVDLGVETWLVRERQPSRELGAILTGRGKRSTEMRDGGFRIQKQQVGADVLFKRRLLDESWKGSGKSRQGKVFTTW